MAYNIARLRCFLR